MTRAEMASYVASRPYDKPLQAIWERMEKLENGDILEERLLGLLNGEFSSLTIDFNDHACNYCSVAQGIEDGAVVDNGWVDEAERERAAATNSVWRIQWYPETPVGFHAVQASTLVAALAALDERQ